jgi:hypothetical protein
VRQATADADGEVLACPDCDQAGDIHERKRAPQCEGDERYRCGKCSALFDDPVRREAKTNTVPAYDDDGLPSGMDAAAKERVRKLREALE